MTETLDVRQAQDEHRDYHPDKILLEILDKAFPGREIKGDWRPVVDGVQFKMPHSREWDFRVGPLNAIGIAPDSYPHRPMLRVKLTHQNMTTSWQIDLDALRKKFEQVRKVAVVREQVEVERQRERDAADALYERVAAAVGYDARKAIGAVYLRSRTPEEVTLTADKVTGAQLVEVEKIIGKQSVSLNLTLDEGQAVRVYRALVPEVKHDS